MASAGDAREVATPGVGRACGPPAANARDADVNEDKAARYHRLKRRAVVISTAGGALLLVAFMVSGTSARLRDAAAMAAALAPPALEPFVVVGAYVACLFLAAEILALPFSAYHGFVLDRRYGLGRQSWRQWLRDSLVAAVLGLILVTGAAEVAYLALRWWPSWWWGPAALAFAIVTLLLTWAAPVVLLPLFYRFVPLEREALRQRLLDLVGRAGTRVLGVYEWKLGEKSRAANAALVGIGPTRRIVISDTLLGGYSDEEIEVVLAHEIAHHVHGDLPRMVLADAALTTGALIACHAALAIAGPGLGLTGPADIAGLPVLLLVWGAWSLATLPVVNAWSRAHERRADAYALDLTANPGAFVSAMKRLGSQNLADEQPSRLVALFHSHPPLPERIAAARAWTPRSPAVPAP
jgi:STE24 endopeptidase